MIKEEKFSKFWKLKRVNTKKKLKGIEHLIWPYKHWLRNILEFSFEQKVIQKHPRILRLKVSRLKQREFSGLLNRILKRDFYVFGSNPRVGGRGCHPEARIVSFFFKRNLTQNCTSVLDQWWLFHSTLFILIPEEIFMNCPCSWRESVGNCVFHNSEPVWSKLVRYWWQMFLGQIFRNAQGKTTIQIQSCSEFWRKGHKWRSETKVYELKFFFKGKNLVRCLN